MTVVLIITRALGTVPNNLNGRCGKFRNNSHQPDKSITKIP